MEQIGLEEYLNCILVHNDVRPAFLVQNIDYGEDSPNDPITKQKLDAIRANFPDLVLSFHREGTLVAKKAYVRIEDSVTMGKTLGYPCAEEFGSINSETPSITYSLIAKLKNNRAVQLMANVCLNDSSYPVMKSLAKKAEAVFKATPDTENVVKSVKVEKIVNVPTKYIIKKLIKGEELTDNEKSGMRNEIFNLGDVENTELGDYPYEFDNPVHRGILLTLMTYALNTPISIFYPLDSKTVKAVDVVNNKWFTNLKNVLDSTRLSPNSGGARKTRKARRN